MTPAPQNNDDKLEETIHRTLRALPERRAPRSLEARVLQEIARRAALPWWKQSYAHWPAAARGGFLVVSALAAAALIAAVVTILRGAQPQQAAAQLADSFTWLSNAREVVEFISGTALSLWRAIPPLWLYGTVAFVASCYAMLVGVGAAAWRFVQAERR